MKKERERTRKEGREAGEEREKEMKELRDRTRKSRGERISRKSIMELTSQYIYMDIKSSHCTP